MGLWPWTINQMMTPKFWKHLKHHGALKTYTKGHQAFRHAHMIGGSRTDSYAKLKGQDQFGNRYYEDFDTDHRNMRRWVEYSDYFLNIWAASDRIPPAYSGWMNHVYDEFPTKFGPSAFVRPIYAVEHTGNISHQVNTHAPAGHVSQENRMKFINEQRNRSRQPWEVQSAGQFQGKKLLNKRQPLFDDVLARE